MGFDVLGVGGAAAAGVTGALGAVNIGGNTSGTTANINSGTMVLAGGSNITLSQNANSITIVGQNQTANTLSLWAPYGPTGTAGTCGQSSVHFRPLNAPAYVSATRMQFWISCSVSTSSNSSHAGTLTFAVGIYTNNASTLSVASSGSVTYAWTNTSDSSTVNLSGKKIITVPINVNMTPGDYWIGVHSMTATANANWITLSNLFHADPAPSNNNQFGQFLAASGTTAGQLYLGQGHWSSAPTTLPSAANINAIRCDQTPDARQIMCYFANLTA